MIFAGGSLSFGSCQELNSMDKKEYNQLTAEEEQIIIHRGTEHPFTGKYNDFYEPGSYHCKQCGILLYRSEDKFSSGCGWPSFDDEIDGAVRRKPDADGQRTEIVCANCGGHLGHVFESEGFTDKNTRHCVNSLSMTFTPRNPLTETAKAYFAGGCFWGVEYLFEKKDGVVSAVSGYMGGKSESPTYQDVCAGNTGHLEVVEVTYNPEKINYEDLAKFFFEIHDPTQKDGQGPDIGEQYLSVVFYKDAAEKATANKLIQFLKDIDYDVATTVRPARTFWDAENYHQDYYEKKKQQPYCHIYKKKF